MFGLEISIPSFGFCRFRVASFVGGAGFSSGPPLLGGVAFVADGLVFVPSFDFVRLKGGRRIRCGLWLASSLRRGGSFQSSPSVGVGFRPSGALPAVADSGLLLVVAGQSCRSSLMAGMADVLGRPFTRLRHLAVSTPLQSPPCGLRRWCRRRL